MKKITTVFYVFAVLALFVLMTGCGSSKKETAESDAVTDVDNDIAVDSDVDADADPEDSEMDADSGETEDADSWQKLPDLDSGETTDLEEIIVYDEDDSACDNDDSEPIKDDSCAIINDNMWAPRASGNMGHTDASNYCYNLTACGYDDWRLPSISELRTLIKNCPNTETGGNCELSDSCLILTDCWNADDCYSYVCNSGNDYSKFKDKGWYWSSSGFSQTFAVDDPGFAYGVDFNYGAVGRNACTNSGGVRCVRKIDGFNTNTGCNVVDGNMWSSKKFFWGNSCDSLTECGFSDWHLPTIDELRTLIRNCEGTVTGGECGVTDECLSKKDCWAQNVCSSCPRDSSGKYSKLGDIDVLFSSSAQADYSSDDWYVNFIYGTVASGSPGTYTEYFYRCVRKYSDDETGGKGCMSDKHKCINSQSLHCEEDYWIPEEYCDYTCDPSTGKCLEAECVSDEYSCGEGNPSTKSRYCKKGRWKIKNCEGECDPSTGKCKDVCHNVEGKMWSPLAAETIYDATMRWQDAVNYCGNLTSCEYSDWHLPTISELRTLIQNCPDTETGGACGVTDDCLESDCYVYKKCEPNNYAVMNGYFSKLGDIRTLWSSSSNGNNSAWTIGFTGGYIYSGSKSSEYYVRCVR